MDGGAGDLGYDGAMARIPIAHRFARQFPMNAKYERKPKYKSVTRHPFEESVEKLTNEVYLLRKKLVFLQKLDLSDEGSRGDVFFIDKTNQGNVITAHRYILAGKSSMFKNMFSNDMTEKRSGEIYIEGMNFSALRAAIDFLYKAEIKFTDQATAAEVYKVAHKYDIPELQAECEAHLLDSVMEENLSEMIRISYTYGAERLKEKSMMIFKENFDRVHSKIVTDLLSRSCV